MLGYIALFICAAFLLWIAGRIASKSSQNRDGAIIAQMVFRGLFLGLLAGLFSGALIGSLGLYIAEYSAPPFGVWSVATGVFGAVLGAFFGAVIGILTGTLLGTITRRFFVPLTNPAFYSSVMIAVGVVSTVLSVLLVGWFLGRSSIELTYDASRKMSDIILYTVAPATFGWLLAIPYSLCVARWYISENYQTQIGRR